MLTARRLPVNAPFLDLGLLRSPLALCRNVSKSTNGDSWITTGASGLQHPPLSCERQLLLLGDASLHPLWQSLPGWQAHLSPLSSFAWLGMRMCSAALCLLVSRCKRIVETGRSKGSKKLNELEDQYTKASDEFREINDEIYQVLPTFYELRRTFYGQMFQTLFGTVAKFHEECTTITDTLAQTMEDLQVASSEESAQHTQQRAFDIEQDEATLQTLRDLSGDGGEAVATMEVMEADLLSPAPPSDDIYEKPVRHAESHASPLTHCTACPANASTFGRPLRMYMPAPASITHDSLLAHNPFARLSMRRCRLHDRQSRRRRRRPVGMGAGGDQETRSNCGRRRIRTKHRTRTSFGSKRGRLYTCGRSRTRRMRRTAGCMGVLWMARAGCSRQILRSSHSAGVTGLLPASQMHYSLRTHIITRAGLSQHTKWFQVKTTPSFHPKC